MKTKAYFAAAIVALSATSASAAIIGVSGPDSSAGSGTPPAIISAPNNVLDDGVTNTGMQGFDEAQNVTLSGPLSVDGGAIAAGTVVDSHMIFLNSTGQRRISHGLGDSAVEWVFDGNILGVMFGKDGANEFASTSELGASGTTYPTSLANRGLESNDFISFSGNTLSIGMLVTEPGDWGRVVTQAAPVPLPAAGVLLLGALGGLGGASALRRRRKTA